MIFCLFSDKNANLWIWRWGQDRSDVYFGKNLNGKENKTCWTRQQLVSLVCIKFTSLILKVISSILNYLTTCLPFVYVYSRNLIRLWIMNYCEHITQPWCEAIDEARDGISTPNFLISLILLNQHVLCFHNLQSQVLGYSGFVPFKGCTGFSHF